MVLAVGGGTMVRVDERFGGGLADLLSIFQVLTTDYSELLTRLLLFIGDTSPLPLTIRRGVPLITLLLFLFCPHRLLINLISTPTPIMPPIHFTLHWFTILRPLLLLFLLFFHVFILLLWFTHFTHCTVNTLENIDYYRAREVTAKVESAMTASYLPLESECEVAFSML